MMHRPPFNMALIIPTGVGASIGGFGGDAMTLLPLMASLCDTVITHPNVANAACFQTLPKNTLYVEGFALDAFFKGEWVLKPVRQNRVGVLWDSGIPEDMEILHRNTVAAVETVYGVHIQGFEKTLQPVDLQLRFDPSGRSTGVIKNITGLLNAAEKLIAQGATAIAVCCLMPEIEDEETDSNYKQGQGVDPIAGLEAMISHLLVSRFQIPCAHAPVFLYENALPVTDHLVDPRAASEFMVSTFLPCVLTGLSQAPQYQTSLEHSGLSIDELSALVVPANALGSVPVLSAVERNIPVLAVETNHTVMQCDSVSLGIESRVIACTTYMEALGHLLALREGVALPKHFYAPSLTERFKVLN